MNGCSSSRDLTSHAITLSHRSAPWIVCTSLPNLFRMLLAYLSFHCVRLKSCISSWRMIHTVGFQRDLSCPICARHLDCWFEGCNAIELNKLTPRYAVSAVHDGAKVSAANRKLACHSFEKKQLIIADNYNVASTTKNN